MPTNVEIKARVADAAALEAAVAALPASGPRVIAQEDVFFACRDGLLKLRVLAEAIADHPAIAVTYFQRDKRKDGGAYVTAIGAVKKIDDCERVIVLMHGEKIAIEDVLHMECELFKVLG